MAKRRGKKSAVAGRSTNKKAPATAELQVPILPAPLPDHLVEDIFVRLPPKSLAVSRCVSPSWNRLISSPAFARLYHAAKAAEATSSAMVRFVSVPLDLHRHQHQHATEVRHDVMGLGGLLHSVCVDCPRVFSGAGMPCHGMVLVGRPCRGDFFVCNPSTGGVLPLPPRRPPWYFHSAGLGYDAAAGKHKAVLLERVPGLPPVPRRWEIPRLQCSVVTVGARQWRWRSPRGRRTPIICEGAVVSTQTDPVFADGRLHWLLIERASDGVLGDLDDILAFMLGTESFKRIALPPFAIDSKLTAPASDNSTPLVRVTLAEVDGRLCLVRDLRGREDAVAVFDVWMLKDCTSGSWLLDRRIDLTPHVGKELMCPARVFVICYVGGETSSGKSKKMVLASAATTTQRAYMYDPDTGVLCTVAISSATQYMRLVLYQDCFLQFAGMDFGKEDIKFEFTMEKSGLSELLPSEV